VPESVKTRLLESLRFDTRIVGGAPVLIEDSPWQVALIRSQVAEPQRSQFCGGSIIASDWVVTAAHCVDNFIVSQLPTRLNVVAGTANYETGGQRATVKRIFVHPAWNSANMDNDVALLQLGEALTMGSPIPVVAANTEFTDPTKLTVTGWGAIFEGGPGSKDLLGVTVPYVANDVCNAADSYNGQVTANMFCAGQREGGLDSCQGDSGGPIWMPVEGKAVLAGVVSWGDGCARQLKYGIYTRLTNYAEWISYTMTLAAKQ
jgi:secreted trypsin-like serine protease